MTLTEWLAVGGTLMGSTGIGAVAVAFVKAKQAKHSTETNAVVKLLPQVQARVETLERKVEERDTKIDAIQGELGECKESHAECRQETDLLKHRITLSEAEIIQLKRSIPPR